MAKGKDKQKSSEKKKPLKTLLEKRKDKKDKKVMSKIRNSRIS